MNMKRALLLAPLLLAACTTDQIALTHTDFDPFTQGYWTNVDGPIDMAHGYSESALCYANQYGQLQKCWPYTGNGTLHEFMSGGFAGLMQGAGLGMGLGMMKPARTEVSNVSNMGGATIGSGAVGSVTASASPVAIGKGGTGGAGGAGGVGYGGSAMATGTGGNAAANSSAAAASNANAAANAKARSDLTSKVCNLPPPHC